MVDVRIALLNWFRVVRKGGYLILYIPHRDLYEKQDKLPSRFNPHHKHMFTLGGDINAYTLDIMEEISRSLQGYIVEYAKVCSEGNTVMKAEYPSDGEYSIEVVIKKLSRK